MPNGNVVNSIGRNGLMEVSTTFGWDNAVFEWGFCDNHNQYCNWDDNNMIGDDGAPIYDSEPRSIKYLCLENHNQTSVMGYGVFCDRFNELEQWELGDINQDGGHIILDIILIIDYILGNQEFTQEQLELADMDGDGTINILDIVAGISDGTPQSAPQLASSIAPTAPAAKSAADMLASQGPMTSSSQITDAGRLIKNVVLEDVGLILNSDYILARNIIIILC